MKRKSRIPSYLTVIATDYPAFLASLIPLFLFFVYLILFILQGRLNRPLLPQALQIIVYVLLGLTLLAVLYMLYRAWLIRQIFQRGSDVQGRITAVEFRRLGGKVAYSYSFGQKRINSVVSLRRNAHTRSVRKGDRVLISVDRESPKRAFIRDLYR